MGVECAANQYSDTSYVVYCHAKILGERLVAKGNMRAVTKVLL